MQPHSAEHLKNHMIVKPSTFSKNTKFLLKNSMLKLQKSLKENNDFVMLECYSLFLFCVL